jgi:hypothetical protein
VSRPSGNQVVLNGLGTAKGPAAGESQSVEMSAVIPVLDEFLCLTGPNAYPISDEGTSAPASATIERIGLVRSCARLCSVLYDGEVSPIGLVLEVAPEWPICRATAAVLRLYEVLGEIISRWGFAYTRRTAFTWGERDKYALAPPGFDPLNDPVVNLRAPLYVTPDEYRDLAWVRQEFRAIQALPSDPASLPLVDTRPPRMHLDRATKVVTLDGKKFTINHPGAFEFYAALYDAEFRPVRSETLRALPACKGRLDQLKSNHIPTGLRHTIGSQPGPNGCYWLQLPPTPKAAKKKRNST